ncbi:MAG TPA: glutamate racemase [Candidatus Saccharibacteria bacterium]|nr:glutamate racemase [Candidatus Saccharibacteria bacterium]
MSDSHTKAKVGVFDSGIGGLSVANAIRQALPELEVVYVNDATHVPYGTKSPEELFGFVLPILQKLVDDGCKTIVVACNTVSTTIIDELRRAISVPLIAMEPMVKPAAEQTKSNTIAVCATPTTLASKRYAWLKETYAQDVKTLEPDCTEWSTMIESNQVNHKRIEQQIHDVCEAGADVIVLGCTHYHWIEQEIRETAKGKALVLQPEQPVITQLRRVLEQLS